MPGPTQLEIRHAYRHLYKRLLRAVCFSKPARYCARDELREAFRKGSRENFDCVKIARTIEFLESAINHKNMEHQIIRNLLLTKFWAKEDAKYRP